MTEQEVFEIIEMISAAYANFVITPKRAELWKEMLISMPYDRVMHNVKRHIKENRFPPSVAEIAAKPKPCNTFLNQIKEWERTSRWNQLKEQGGVKDAQAN